MINPSTSRNKSFFLSSFLLFPVHSNLTSTLHHTTMLEEFLTCYMGSLYLHRAVLFCSVHTRTPTHFDFDFPPSPPNLCIVWYSTSEEPSQFQPPFYTLHTKCSAYDAGASPLFPSASPSSAGTNTFFSSSIFASSPFWCIATRISQPPTNSLSTYSCGIVGHSENSLMPIEGNSTRY